MSTTIFDYLTSLNIHYTTYDHPPLFSVEQSVAAFEQYPNVPPFGMVKNLFLKDNNKRLWLIVALFDTVISLKDLAKKLQAPGLRFAQPETLMQHLGVIPGAVTPLGLINDKDHAITVILDAAIAQYEIVGVHPLTNLATTMLRVEDLKRFITSCGTIWIELDLCSQPSE